VGRSAAMRDSRWVRVESDRGGSSARGISYVSLRNRENSYLGRNLLILVVTTLCFMVFGDFLNQFLL
jgi:hypothetical protein